MSELYISSSYEDLYGHNARCYADCNLHDVKHPSLYIGSHEYSGVICIDSILGKPIVAYHSDSTADWIRNNEKKLSIHDFFELVVLTHLVGMDFYERTKTYIREFILPRYLGEVPCP